MDSGIYGDFQHYKGQEFYTQALSVQSTRKLYSQKSNFKHIYLMRFAVKMLHSVSMENAERKSRFRVDLLRILKFMSFFLDSFELSKQECLRLNDVGRVSF